MLFGIVASAKWSATLAALVVMSASPPSPGAGQILVDAELNQHERHSALLVDRKYWRRNTEFGERDNWRDKMKPCTLLERIYMAEQAVVSMGDSLDEIDGSLEANINDLSLAPNGILLLEEDAPVASTDPLYIKYLNDSGDCSESLGAAALGNQRSGRLFEFAPDSDQMSWFNPDNWYSSLDDSEAANWAPDSHQIPCGEDVVVIGDRRANVWTVLEASERERSMSFKINFRPSEHNDDATLRDLAVDNLRVAKMIIANRSYSQSEFQRLIESDAYRNLLFDLGRVSPSGEEAATSSVISVDESSINANGEIEWCLDEAGCLCGNERPELMRLICSFHEPIKPEEQPCHDPLVLPGHCNKVCASSLTIVMDPTKFSERFIVSHINNLMDKNAEYYEQYVFIGSRRTHVNLYEITMRLVPSGTSGSLSYRGILGRDREFAQLVIDSINKDESLKIFYGIKSMAMRSSLSWKKGNRFIVFCAYLVIALIVVGAICARDGRYLRRLGLPTGVISTPLSFAGMNLGRVSRSSVDNSYLDEESFVQFEPITDDDRSIDQQSGEILLADLDKTDDIGVSETF